MSPVSHLLFSWLSSAEIIKARRERVLVTVSGISPDVDGLGLIIDKITGSTHFYFQYHHYIGHSIFFALLISILASCFAKSQKLLVFLLSFFVVHVHIFCDLIGSRSPDGYQWPIHYLYPTNSDYELTWVGQWELNAWQNQMIFLFLIVASIYYGVTKRITFFEVFSSKLNREVFKMYYKYFAKRE